ncbi:unnamed protein product [Gordionus sp. m RMFG-2023]
MDLPPEYRYQVYCNLLDIELDRPPRSPSSHHPIILVLAKKSLSSDPRVQLAVIFGLMDNYPSTRLSKPVGDRGGISQLRNLSYHMSKAIHHRRKSRKFLAPYQD